MAYINLRGVSKQFPNGSQALDHVSFSVREHEVITIVGPSGCGKSTLLRLIAGLETPSGGTIQIRGNVVNSLPARLRNVAMVFQSYALYPHMTCFENLALSLRLRKIRRDEIGQRVQETARLLEIEELLFKKPRELSGGQRQRVAVGRALIRNPDVFLFDEPLSNLDALLRERVRHELKELFRKIQATVVYVTHDQVEATTLADRVVVLNKGSVQQIGKPEELYRTPVNSFVAAFIGSPSMNLIERDVTQGEFWLGPEAVRTPLNWSGAAIVGIRPEDISLTDVGIPASVRWVEHLGAQYLVGVQAGDTCLSVISGRRPVSDTVHLRVEPDTVHVFEKTNGTSLALVRPRDPARPQP